MFLLNPFRFGGGGPAPPTPSTWDPANKHAQITLSGGNKIATSANVGGGDWESVRGTQPLGANIYFELAYGNAGNTVFGGIIDSAQNLAGDEFAGKSANSFGWLGVNGFIYKGGVQIGTVSAHASGDILGFAINASGRLFIAKNNVWQNSGDPVAGTGYVATLAATIYPGCSMLNSPGAFSLRAATADQAYAPPTGYTALG